MMIIYSLEYTFKCYFSENFLNLPNLYNPTDFTFELPYPIINYI